MKFTDGELYYYIVGASWDYAVNSSRWRGSKIDEDRLDSLNAFKSREDAEKAIVAIKQCLKDVHEELDKEHRPIYAGRYFKYGGTTYYVVAQADNGIHYKDVVTGTTENTMCWEMFNDIVDRGELKWLKFIPWTFKTAPTIVRVKRVSDDTIDILSLDIYVKRGERVVGLYSDTRDVDITFEEALKQYVTLSGNPCGALVDEDYDQSEQEQFKTAELGS